MTDIAIRSSSVTAVPDPYRIPDAQELLPKSVRATMDGTGAGVAWFPCLQILDPAGNVMSESIANSSVAAGASADVSWFPGVKAAAAAAPPTPGSGVNWAYISGIATRACNSGTTTNLTASATRFYTNAPTVFTHGTDGSGNVGIVLSANGHFLSTYTVDPFGVPTAGSHWILFQNGGGNIAGNDYFVQTPPNPNGGDTNDWDVTTSDLFTVGGSVSPPTPPIIGQIQNDGAHNVTMGGPGNYVIQLDTNGTDIF